MTGTSAAVQATYRRSAYRPYREAGRNVPTAGIINSYQVRYEHSDHVRRSFLHSASPVCVRAGKAPYPKAPSSFPNRRPSRGPPVWLYGGNPIYHCHHHCRKLPIACDDFLCFAPKVISRSFRCSSFPNRRSLRGTFGLDFKREGGNRLVPAFAPLQFFVSVLLLVVQLFGPLQRVHAVEAYRFPAFFTEKAADVFRPIPADAARDGVQTSVVQRADVSDALFPVHGDLPPVLFVIIIRTLFPKCKTNATASRVAFIRFFNALFLFPEQTIGAFGPAPFLCILPIDKGRKIPV